MAARMVVDRKVGIPVERDGARPLPPPGRLRNLERRRSLPWRLLSRISTARRVALITVAAFEVSEVVLLWSKGMDRGNWIAVALGFTVLLVLVGFEAAEHAAAERDHELSQEISEWLLPGAPPSIPGTEIAFAHRMADHVGCDYFNAFPRWTHGDVSGARHLFIVVADVAGVGMQGALLMATFQASLRTLADSGMPIEDLAARLNQWSWDRSMEGRHFTAAFLAELDPRTGVLDYVSAGHQPPLVHRPDGGVQRLDVSGFPLGVMPDSVYEKASAFMAVGDTLVAFTDGVVRAEDHSGEEFGEDRVIQSLRTTSASTANEVANHLRSALLSFCGSRKQRDDLSLVVVRRCR